MAIQKMSIALKNEPRLLQKECEYLLLAWGREEVKPLITNAVLLAILLVSKGTIQSFKRQATHGVIVVQHDTKCNITVLFH